MSDSLRSLMLIANKINQELIANDGELTPELEERLTKASQDVAQKVDSYAIVLSQIDSSIEHHRHSANLHRSHAQRLERTKQWLLTNLKNEAIANGGALNGSEYRASLRNNPDSVHITNEALIPHEFKSTEVITHVDKNKIKELLKLGLTVAGAELQSSQRLHIDVRNTFYNKELNDVQKSAEKTSKTKNRN